MDDENVVIEHLHALFSETFHIDVPSPDTDLLESGTLDSLQFVEMLVQLETRFHLTISIDDLDLDDLQSLRRIAQLVAAHSASTRVTAA
ncbi:MAG TPA: phosphopantetheine-binding protein [Burkholderiales bacterium]